MRNKEFVDSTINNNLFLYITKLYWKSEKASIDDVPFFSLLGLNSFLATDMLF